MIKSTYLRAAWIMTLAVSLFGCGSGGGGGSVATQGGPSGTVVQGPVQGATVFCDQITVGGLGNYQIDAAEESTMTTTGADGSFTIPVKPPYAEYVIVSQGGTDTITGQPALQMLAPAGARNISPLTTLVALDSQTKSRIEALGIKYDDNVAENATPAALLLLKSIETTVGCTIAILNPGGNTLPPNQVRELQKTILEHIARKVKSQGASQLTNVPLLEVALTSALQDALTTIDAEYDNVSVGSNAATLAASVVTGVVPAVAKIINPSNTFSTNPNDRVSEGAVFKGEAVKAINDKVSETVVNNVDLATSGASNTAPAASNGTLSVVAGNTATGTLGGSDANENRLTFMIVTNGSQGTATIINRIKGTFAYTANAGASGTDTFTFKVSDGIADSNIATITVTITGSGGGGMGDVRIEGDVTAVDVTAGRVTVLTVPVTVTNGTEIRDNSSFQMQTFTLADLAVGNHVEIEGFQDGSGNVIATRLERRNPDSRAILEGVATAKSGNTSFVILGVTVTVNPAVTDFEDVNDTEILVNSFFDLITPNVTVVKARWDPYSSITQPPGDAEIEN